MLVSMSVRNFKSIVDLKIDFSYDEGKAPNGYKKSSLIPFLEPTKKPEDRLVPVMMFYGANASGKSNIVKALSTLKQIVHLGSEYYNI